MNKSVIIAVVIAAIAAGMIASVIGQVAYAGPGSCPKCFHHGQFPTQSNDPRNSESETSDSSHGGCGRFCI